MSERCQCPDCLEHDATVAATLDPRLASDEQVTHGRHCTCGACSRQDWTDADLAPCGMHGADCPAFYQPWGRAGSYVNPEEVKT